MENKSDSGLKTSKALKTDPYSDLFATQILDIHPEDSRSLVSTIPTVGGSNQ